ncbi:MAG: DUF1893 domain-containing protein [Tissierellia bacterium]|nr:DUF1893 domain-containing protein [Tissierellia bacterium]
MKDIDLARKLLYEEDLSLVVVKNSQLIYKSHDKGIRPMYYLVTDLFDKAKGSSIADKVIGKGAAILCKMLRVKEIYTPLISEAAMEVLNKANIPFTYHRSCPYIMNMKKTGLCPIEKIAIESKDEKVLLERLEAFLNSMDKG